MSSLVYSFVSCWFVSCYGQLSRELRVTLDAATPHIVTRILHTAQSCSLPVCSLGNIQEYYILEYNTYDNNLCKVSYLTTG